MGSEGSVPSESVVNSGAVGMREGGVAGTCQSGTCQGEAERESVSSEESKGAGFECKICLDRIVEPVVTKCGHLFCWPCIYQWLGDDRHKECPCCKAINITVANLIPLYIDEIESRSLGKEPKYLTADIPARPKAHVTYAKPFTRQDEFDITAIDLTDMRRFVSSPIPMSAGTMQCYVKRVRHFRKTTEYFVYMKEGDHFLMYGRRKALRTSHRYQISLDAPQGYQVLHNSRPSRRTSIQDNDTTTTHSMSAINTDVDTMDGDTVSLTSRDDGSTRVIGTNLNSGNPESVGISTTGSSRRSSSRRREPQEVIGRLQANFFGTEFQAYDNGYDPADIRRRGIDELPRREYAAIMYEPNIFGRKGPRRMQVAIPLVDEESGEMHEWRSHAKPQELISFLRLGNISAFKFLINKPPRWNDEVR